jgi:hypothetical protein
MSAFNIKQRQEASDGWSLNSRLGNLDLGLEGEESICELLALLESQLYSQETSCRLKCEDGIHTS